MNLLDRLHAFAAKLGLSPKVFDPLALAATAVVVNLIAGNPLDLDAVRVAVGVVVLGLVAGSAPPALGTDQRELNVKAKRVARNRSR